MVALSATAGCGINVSQVSGSVEETMLADRVQNNGRVSIEPAACSAGIFLAS